MNSFAIFAILYMTAFLMEMLEKWKYPGFTLGFLALIMGLALTGVSRLKFFIFLVLTTSYFIIFRFPDVANHVNLFIYINLVLSISMIYDWFRYSKYSTDDDYYVTVQPILRLSLIAVYFWAGFHKLNTDFLNPEISCSSTMLDRIQEAFQSDLLGIPVPLMIIMSSVALGVKGISLFVHHPFVMSKIGQFSLLGLLTCTGVAVYSFVFAPTYYVEIPDLILRINIFLVLGWELIGGLLLFMPRLQAPILLFSWLMHAFIAMIGFVDFSALAFSLLFTFIPDTHLAVWQRHPSIAVGKWTVHRAYLYLGLNGMVGLFSALFFLARWSFDIDLVAGTLFNGAAIAFLWPLLSTLWLPKQRPAWQGVPIINRKTPRFMWSFLIALCLFGFTPYLGLRTTGNFSMFSNLRTEGVSSNHLLLSGNPFKVWDYQEDTVQFFDVDQRVVAIDPKLTELDGHSLPIVEFKKMLYQWTKAGYTVPLKFEYQGQLYDSPNIVNDPVWRTSQRNWEMFWMDFRVIQPHNAGPNLCRW